MPKCGERWFRADVFRQMVAIIMGTLEFKWHLKLSLLVRGKGRWSFLAPCIDAWYVEFIVNFLARYGGQSGACIYAPDTTCPCAASLPECAPAKLMPKRSTGCSSRLVEDDSHGIVPHLFNTVGKSLTAGGVPHSGAIVKVGRTNNRYSIFLVFTGRYSCWSCEYWLVQQRLSYGYWSCMWLPV